MTSMNKGARGIRYLEQRYEIMQPRTDTNYNVKHPEKSPNEVFFCNVVVQLFGNIKWPSKRQGCVAYDMAGKALRATIVPCFISKEDHKLSLEKRKKLQTQEESNAKKA